MKAISLWQPWASAIALGFKTVETRSWATKHRGDLLICSSCKDTPDQERVFYKCIKPVAKNLTYNMFPFGKAVAVVNIYDVVLMTDEFISKLSPLEKKVGLWGIGRYAWLLNNIRPIEPFEVSGKQRLFDVDFDYESY